MRRSTALFLALLLALSLAPSLAAETPPRADRLGRQLAVAPAADASVLATDRGPAIEVGGRRLALPLPADAAVDRVATAAGRWAVAGHRQGDDGAELVVAMGEGGGARPLAPPIVAGAELVLSANPLLSADGLVALAWLEGDRPGDLAVRVARRAGERWLPTETVSPAGPGSQMALSGAVLADGSLLLVWAAFDGGDDEILWSRFAGDAWSAPRALADDNRVPDVTPRVIAWGDGALAAWSRFAEGAYQIELARFDGADWEAARTVSDRGAGAPALVAASDGTSPLLVYRRAEPSSWVIAELDDTAAVTARAAVPAVAGEASDAPPRVLRDGDGVVASWGDGVSRRASWTLER